MPNPSHDANSIKCFPAIFRRLLCAGSLPTHPSEQFPDLKTKETSDPKNPPEMKPSIPENNPIKHAANIPSPGVVARLMGLDSFPTQKDRTLGSYFRSRSVNSIDFLSHFDPIKPINHRRHRRVRTSVSFREGVFNEDYTSVVLMEKLDETVEECREEMTARRRASEKKIAKKPRKKVDSIEEKRTSKKELKEKRPRTSVLDSKEEFISGRKHVKGKKKNILAHDKAHSRCSMRKVHPQGSVPEKLRLRSNIPNSESPGSSPANSDNWEGIRAITKDKDERKTKNNESSCYYKRMAEEICRATEEDLKENWMAFRFDDSEEICLEFGQEILEALLRQIVDELMLIYVARN